MDISNNNQIDLLYLTNPRIKYNKTNEYTHTLSLDDIKFYNMLNLWDEIESPKIDLTSLSHWSGTGLVDISDRLKIKK